MLLKEIFLFTRYAFYDMLVSNMNITNATKYLLESGEAFMELSRIIHGSFFCVFIRI